jgi:hypothetical protein
MSVTEAQSSSPGESQAAPASALAPANTSQANPATTTTSESNPAAQTTSAAPARPAYIPENFWDGAAGKVKDKEFGDHLAQLTTRVAADDSRRLSLPQKPEDYKIELPSDFKPPAGVKYEFNADDPLMAQARATMHDIETGKLTGQAAFSKLLGLYAGAQVATEATIQAAKTAEHAKLGANGPARVTALQTFFKGYLGDNDGAQLASRLFTAKDVEIAERLVAKMTNSGTFNAGGREPPEPAGRLSSEQVAKLPAPARLDYARKFNQSQMPAWKDPRVA